MTHADINDLETRDYIFKIGDRGKGIQARYDENTDALIFPRVAFDYVCELLNEALSQEQKSGKWIDKEISNPDYPFQDRKIIECSKCHYGIVQARLGYTNFCPNCGARMESGDKE